MMSGHIFPSNIQLTVEVFSHVVLNLHHLTSKPSVLKVGNISWIEAFVGVEMVRDMYHVSLECI